MNILAPVNKPGEVKKIIDAGADELYCGVNPAEWLENYSNVVSSNRREWSAANLVSFKALKEVVKLSHEHHTPVHLTLNALYTNEQYPMVEEFLQQIEDMKVDFLIVADLGLLMRIKEKKMNAKVCMSTGGTTFNNSTVDFYSSLGVDRIILPRQLTLHEIEDITNSNKEMEFEVFIMNSGCKNIDGFCTYQHGVNEILHSIIWKITKKLNVDQYILKFLQALPDYLREKIYDFPFGVDSACLLNYEVSLFDEEKFSVEESKFVCKRIKKAFSLQYAIDCCGGCALKQLSNMYVKGIKIVGRNYPTNKKINDVKFINSVVEVLKNYPNQESKRKIKELYKQIYGIPCRELCYYKSW